MDKDQIIALLATSLNRNDEDPNIQLAVKLAEEGTIDHLKSLFEIIHSEKTSLKNDAIKVIYEIGARNPTLVSTFLEDLLSLLNSKNNRLQWGAMTAIQTIADEAHESVFENLVRIVDAADNGSVITRDQAMKIMFRLLKHSQYEQDVMALIFEQLRRCPTNQLPMYAEELALVIPEAYTSELIVSLQKRIPEIEKASKIQRIEKVIKKCSIN